MNFIRRLNRGNFYFSKQCFQIWWLNSSIEFRKTYKIQLDIFKIMAVRPKKHRNMGCEYHYSCSYKDGTSCYIMSSSYILVIIAEL